MSRIALLKGAGNVAVGTDSLFDFLIEEGAGKFIDYILPEQLDPLWWLRRWEVERAIETMEVTYRIMARYPCFCMEKDLERLNLLSRGGIPRSVLILQCPIDITVEYNGETLSTVPEMFNTETEWGRIFITDENNDEKILVFYTDSIFDIKITGTGTGTMDYTAQYFNENGIFIEERRLFNVPITETTVITTETVQGEPVVMVIDENGDGAFDILIESRYFINAVVDTGGFVLGGGEFSSGTTIELFAVPFMGYVFDGWYENGVRIDKAESAYSFTITAHKTLEARFILCECGQTDCWDCNPEKFNITLLQNLINDANELLDDTYISELHGADIPTNRHWTTQQDRQNLIDAITAALAVLDGIDNED